jgi:hypothetical protein
MDIVSGLAAAKQALDIAKALKGIEKSYDQATLKAQLADLVSALADAKMSMVDAKEALAGKDKEIEALKLNFQTRELLVRGDGDYLYFAGPNDKPLGFPICPACEPDGKLIQLKRNGRVTDTVCPKCKSEFTPVTCYLPPEAGDETLKKQNDRLTSEGMDRLNRSLAGRSPW